MICFDKSIITYNWNFNLSKINLYNKAFVTEDVEYISHSELL